MMYIARFSFLPGGSELGLFKTAAQPVATPFHSEKCNITIWTGNSKHSHRQDTIQKNPRQYARLHEPHYMPLRPKRSHMPDLCELSKTVSNHCIMDRLASN
jgi:hypothetical protein